MHKVRLSNRILEVPDDMSLADILIKSGETLPHLCGGIGTCKKCLVMVNGKPELSCQYKIKSDIDVIIPEEAEIYSVTSANESKKESHNLCFCLDIGTTTLALALVSLDNKEVIEVKTASNPQRAFGGDVISRIDYCSKNGTTELHRCLINKINSMINNFALGNVNTLYASGNTTMLHLFLGVNCSSMGTTPYTPIFIDSKKIKAKKIGLKNIENIITLPCISAFVGADIVAGINFTDLPKENKYNLLVDLGTNAEIVLYNKNALYCTSAAAGPCFEGASITSGMSATDGAIYSYSPKETYKTINNKTPKGICGTGLIDIIAVLLEKGIIDKTGYMSCEEFFITDSIKLTQKDVRQFQLAKSAVYSGISAILQEMSISFKDIEKLFISGGFSAKINIENAVKIGILPSELKDKVVILNNSSLLGTVKYATEQNDLSVYTKKAEYIDLSSNPHFNDNFIMNMDFNNF